MKDILYDIILLIMLVGSFVISQIGYLLCLNKYISAGAFLISNDIGNIRNYNWRDGINKFECISTYKRGLVNNI